MGVGVGVGVVVVVVVGVASGARAAQQCMCGERGAGQHQHTNGALQTKEVAAARTDAGDDDDGLTGARPGRIQARKKLIDILDI